MNSVGSLNKSARSNFSNNTGASSRRSDGGSYREGGKPSRSGTPGRERRPSNHEGGQRSSSRSRPRQRSRSRPRGREEEEPRDRARSKSRGRAPSVGRNGGRSVIKRRSKKEYDSPFDSKGRCHYHAQVQLAKKKLMGGWNVRLSLCNCKSSPALVLHCVSNYFRCPSQVLLDVCPKCMEESYINDDNRSVASGRSTRSNRSVKSSKSIGRVFSKNKKIYESPFDSDGYCHRHSHVRLAKKKTLGGWKIIQSFCNECAKEDVDDNASAKSGHSRRSAYSRSSRVSKSDRRSSRSRYEDDDTESAHSTSQSEQVKKKMVKKMRFRDEDTGEEGLYSGYVNGEYQPHGSGKIVYQNGDRYEGTWCEGSKVHGKTSRAKGSSSISSSRPVRDEDGSRGPDRNSHRRMKRSDSSSHDGSASTGRPKPQDIKKQMEDYREMYTDAFPVILEAKKVKGMRFVDYYGDPGRYTGEVNDANMPHGMGEITYDHGLVQGGKWVSAQLFIDMMSQSLFTFPFLNHHAIMF